MLTCFLRSTCSLLDEYNAAVAQCVVVLGWHISPPSSNLIRALMLFCLHTVVHPRMDGPALKLHLDLFGMGL